MVCNVKKFLISVFLLKCLSLFCVQYINAMEVERRAPRALVVSYNDYVAAPDPIVLDEHNSHYLLSEEINRVVQAFLRAKNIDAASLSVTGEVYTEEYKQQKAAICPKFVASQFEVKKCAGESDYSVIAFFPPTSGPELTKYVFKTPFDGKGQDNFKRVFYAHAINKYLHDLGITSMRAPQKHLFLIPDGDPGEYTDANYKVVSEKINIAHDRGNPFDLMTPAELKTLLDIVFRFGWCDLHVESFPQERNIVYDDHGSMIFIDTESHGDKMSTYYINDNFDAYYFSKDKAVLPEEFFIAQKLLGQPKGSDNYKLGRTLARWIHILNMGLFSPYRYYNFDTSWPAPQGDTLKNNPRKLFDFGAFANHRRVIREGIYTVMKHIILCTQEIETKFPGIRQESLEHISTRDFGPQWGGNRHYVYDRTLPFIIMPINDYLTFSTQRGAEARVIYRYNSDGSPMPRVTERLSEIPGLIFSALEREFLALSPALPPRVAPAPVPPKTRLVGSSETTPVGGLPTVSPHLPQKRPKAPGGPYTFSAMKPPKGRVRVSPQKQRVSPQKQPVFGPSDVRPTGVQPIKLSNLQGALLNLRERLIKLNEKLMQLKRAH